MYLALKWIHVLAAVIALGTNLTYSIWLTQIYKSPDSLLFTLRTIKILDDRLANPAYIISLISGLGMVFVAGLSITTPWLLLSLILYVTVVIIGLGGYSLTLKKQIAVVEGSGALSAEYAALARRGQMLGIILGILVVSIIYLMVAKPLLWG